VTTSTFASKAFVLSSLAFLNASLATGQQTVFNVPSADVMDKGRAYMEWDASVGDSAATVGVTPRSVNGLGHGMEAGVNVASFNFPDSGSVTVVPTLKWKFYENVEHGWVLFAGEQVYVPVKKRTYTVGNSAYVEAAKSFKSGTRIGVGVYDFSAHVMDPANRGGIQASIEQTLTKRIGLATDWYSGNNSMGYVTPGLSCKIGTQLTAYAAYEIGNHDLLSGNHSIFLVLGWNPTVRTKSE
jgi:hypothetical protein